VLNLRRFVDGYSGAISFLESPITENFLTDIKEQLRVEFENLLEVYQNMIF
jgi:hypothetical protein